MRSLGFLRWWVWHSVILLAAIAPAQTERIRFYHSEIKVQEDGAMLVREDYFRLSALETRSATRHLFS